MHDKITLYIKLFFVFYSILSFKILMFISFKYPLLHSIKMISYCILGEKYIIFCLALWTRSVFPPRTTFYMPRPKLFLIISSFIILSYIFIFYYKNYLTLSIIIYLYLIIIWLFFTHMLLNKFEAKLTHCFVSSIWHKPRAAQEFERLKTNLKNEAFYLKLFFELFLMQNYLWNYHN